MRKKYKPREFAPTVAQFFARNPRCALWAKPGMGKTVLTLTHLDILHNVIGESAPTLVLAPMRVARDVWPSEAKKWQHIDLDVSVILGTPEQREVAARKTDVAIHTMNYENLPWLVEHWGKRWPYRTVIADESTRLKGFRLTDGGIRAQALGRVAHKKVRNWINLTGTPAANGLQDLWGQTWFIDGGERLGRTYGGFQERWMRPVITGERGQQRVKWEFAQHAGDEIHERVSDVCLSLDPRDWFDLAEPVYSTIKVQLRGKARRVYDELEEQMFADIGQDEVLTAFSASAKSMKCRQLANGAVYTDESGAWAPIHDEKLDALDELVSESGDDKLLVAYHFKSDRDRILDRYPDAIDLATPQGLNRARAGQGQMWLAQPQSVGHGVDGLQEHCHTVVFFGHDWSLENRDQVIDRVGPVRQFQIGSGEVVRVYDIIASGTIDEAIAISRRRKTRVQDALIDYMKGKI